MNPKERKKNDEQEGLPFEVWVRIHKETEISSLQQAKNRQISTRKGKLTVYVTKIV